MISIQLTLLDKVPPDFGRKALVKDLIVHHLSLSKAQGRCGVKENEEKPLNKL